MKPTKCPAKEKKNEARKVKKRGGEKAKDCCVTLKPKNSKFCFLRMPELHKLIFCIWKRLRGKF